VASCGAGGGFSLVGLVGGFWWRSLAAGRVAGVRGF